MASTLSDEQRVARYRQHVERQLSAGLRLALDRVTADQWRTAHRAHLHGAQLGLRLLAGADGVTAVLLAVWPDGSEPEPLSVFALRPSAEG